MRGESAAGLQAELAGLAGAELLDLPARREREEGEVVGAVLRWLRENPGWLLIVDNADTEEAARAMAALLPRLQGGQVVVTSRIAVWPAGVETREMLPIVSESAARFLLERTTRTQELSEDDRGAGREAGRIAAGAGAGGGLHRVPPDDAALAIDEASYGSEHPAVIRMRANLAQMVQGS